MDLILVRNELAGIHQTFLVRAFICSYKRFYYIKELYNCLNVASNHALPASHLDSGVHTHLCMLHIWHFRRPSHHWHLCRSHRLQALHAGTGETLISCWSPCLSEPQRNQWPFRSQRQVGDWKWHCYHNRGGELAVWFCDSCVSGVTACFPYLYHWQRQRASKSEIEIFNLHSC